MDKSNDYPVGTKLICHNGINVIKGIVVENYKIPGDICVDWETGEQSSYNKEWLDSFTTRIDDE